MRKLLAGAATLALILPVSVSAATAQELAAQIEALLKQVETLQKQINAGPTQASGSTGGQSAIPGTGTFQCPSISRILKRGSTGIEVTQLQQFLALDPAVYPEAQVTGYYGALTEAAVKKFQCKHGIICTGTPASTGHGNVGPVTASYIMQQCPNIAGTSETSDTVSGFMRVTPTSGGAPLAVKVDVILNSAKSCKSQTYEVFFGDSAAPVNVTVPANFCNELTQTLQHTYTANGTYVLSLRAGVFQDSVQITVSGEPSANAPTLFSASPLTGTAPLNVTFTGTRNINNQCNMGSYIIEFGDGKSETMADAGCQGVPFSIAHSYTNVGNYIAKFYRAQLSHEVVSVGIGVGGGSGGSFSVTPGTGGNAKAATATFELASTCTAYDIDWGDGSAHTAQAQGSCSSGVISKSEVHTYANTGSYTITLKRGASLDAVATIGLTLQ